MGHYLILGISFSHLCNGAKDHSMLPQGKKQKGFSYLKVVEMWFKPQGLGSGEGVSTGNPAHFWVEARTMQNCSIREGAWAIGMRMRCLYILKDSSLTLVLRSDVRGKEDLSLQGAHHVGSHDIFQHHGQDPPSGLFQGRRGPPGLQPWLFGAPGFP